MISPRPALEEPVPSTYGWGPAGISERFDGPEGTGTTEDVGPCRGPAVLGPVGADGWRDVPPDHPYLRYLGRIDVSRPEAPRFAYPGAAVRIRFEGDALVLRFRDHGPGGEQGTNYYDVSIDAAAPKVLAVVPGSEQYLLGKALGPGLHVAELFKRNESGAGGPNAGLGEFLGFRLPARGRVLPLELPRLRLEVIGDSITCGYGNELSTDEPDDYHYTAVRSNAHLAYGAIAARSLGAQYLAVAYSGRGVYRNYADIPGALLPALWERVLPDDPDSPRWDPSLYVPDVIVLNLGTNDFSPGEIDRERFQAAYAKFLERLRGHYPRALLVATVGPTLTDAFPPGALAWTSIQSDVRGLVEARAVAGDPAVRYLAFAQQRSPYGEDWHPTVATHQAMADQLSTFLRRELGV